MFTHVWGPLFTYVCGPCSHMCIPSQSGIPAKATLIFDVELLDAKFMTDAEVHAVNMKVESLRR